MSDRVADRIKRLRDRFGHLVKEREVDHDHDHLTGTRREQLSRRTFFLGEVWTAARDAIGNRGPHQDGSVPALVTRRQEASFAPVEMAPGANRAPEDIDTLCFLPAGGCDGCDPETVFLLPYRRPVYRDSIGAPIGKLQGADVQELARMLDFMRK
jgi:hypothetical protein